MGFFEKLKSGLKKTSDAIGEQVNQVFSVFTKVDEELFENLEEALIMADIGMETSEYIIGELRSRVQKKHITEAEAVKIELQAVIRDILSESDAKMHLEGKPAVILVIGVNGVGKTTTIGKLATNFRNDGKKVLLAAADTFRAAATQQLVTWAERSGADIVTSFEGADPASVVYDAISSAKAKNTDCAQL